MSATKTRLALATAALAVVTLTSSARAQNGGVAERVGEALDNTGRAIKNGVQGATTRARSRVVTMEVLDRVYSRLHWEKSLANSTLDIEVQPGGVTILRGVVPSAPAKTKAVSLARDTVGVMQVVDELSIATIVEPTAPAPVVTPTRRIP